METISAECDSCGGSGVYCGFAEPPGVGVICLSCDGEGARLIKYKPFKERKRRGGVKVVRRSRGGFLATGVGPVGKEISYDEFLRGKKP